MKKTLSLSAVSLAAVMWFSSGFCSETYVSGSIGVSWFDNSQLDYIYSDADGDPLLSQTVGFDSGIALLGAYGCDYGAYRVEAELGYQRNDLTNLTVNESGEAPAEEGTTFDYTGKVSIASLLFNAYYDIDLGGAELSLGAGIGVAQVDMSDIDHENDEGDDFVGISASNIHETTLAWQLGAVLGIPVADNVMLDARYRYFATTDATVDNANANLETHNVLLGLRLGL